jgi:hypothetical protein
MESQPIKNVRRSCTAKVQTVAREHGVTPLGMVPYSTAQFFEDIRKPLIRSSPLGCLDDCPRKFLYTYKLGIQTRKYESPLVLGQMVHSILEGLFLGFTEEEALNASALQMKKEFDRLTEATGPDGFIGLEDAGVMLKQLDEDFHKARAMALIFWRSVPFDPSKWEILKAPDGTRMAEVLLETKYPGLSVPLLTPTDLALVKKETGGVWIVDYKTTGMDAKVRAIPTKFSGQLQLYRIGLQAHLDEWGRGEKVEGSLHAIIQKPGIKYCPRTKDKAGFHSYITRLAEWYKAKEEKDPSNPPMILDPNTFEGPAMTQEFWGRLKQFCAASNATPSVDHFYRNDGACLRWNKACRYMPLCQSHPAMWPHLIRDHYEIRFREDEENA